MIAKNLLGYKLERTEEKLTAHSGAIVFGEFLYAMGLSGTLKSFPKPLNELGYGHMEYIVPIMIMLYAGGRSIAHMREIRYDRVLRELVRLTIIPSDSAIGDWLKKMGERDGVKAINKAIDAVNLRIFAQSPLTELTLVNDPTIISTSKRDAKMTYLGTKGYRPGLAFIKELGIVIAQEFREGNDMGDKLAFIKLSFSKVPKGKKIKHVLLDAEFYIAEVINFLEEQGCTWAVVADQDNAVKAVIKAIPDSEWKPLMDRDGFKTDREVAETVHCMGKTKKAFRLVVIRWKDEDDILCHHAIANNHTAENPGDVVHYYNQRATQENVIKEAKGGFGMDIMPSGDFAANALYFAIGILTYNYFIAQKVLIMPPSLQNKVIETIRWMLVEIPGKLVRHANTTILKIKTDVEKFNIFEFMRERMRCLSSA
jgi:hypothetical protein